MGMGRVTYALLTLLLVLSLGLNAALYYRLRAYEEQNELLNSTLEQYRLALERLQKENSMLNSTLDYYKSLLTSTSPSGGVGPPVSKLECINAVAVKTVYEGGFRKFEGTLMEIVLEVRPGSGRVLVSTSPKMGVDFQTAARTAVKVVSEKLGLDTSKYDVIFSVKAKDKVDVVDGPSAGGAMAVLLYSYLTGKKLNGSVVMTGTINPDGSIGKVGGVLEKGEAAAESGMKLFLVPEGQKKELVYYPEKHEIGGLVIITYKPKLIDLGEYFKKYGMEVVEVKTLDDALKYFIL